MHLDSQTIERIRQKAGALAGEQLDFLADLVRPDSGTGNIDGNLEVTRRVASALESFPGGARTEIAETPAGRSIIARIGPAGAPLKVLGLAHLDTVFGPGESERHPFQVDGDKVRGLGVADCKGGVAVSLFGARAAMELGLWPENLELTLLYTCDEETGSHHSRELFGKEAREADYCLVFEPSRGESGIITARKGCALGNLTAKGAESHALSAYEAGADANLALAKAIAQICEQNDPAAGRFFNFGRISGGKHPDIVSDEAAGEFFVTFADSAELGLIQGVLRRAAENPAVPGAALAATLDVSLPPLVPTPESLAAYGRVREAGALLGLELPEQSSPGSSDGCWVASHGVPVIDALGPYMHDIHTTKEAARLSSFPERTALFAAVIAGLGCWPARAGR